jgi:hypothetical protein
MAPARPVGMPEAGPYPSPLEDGMMNFHSFLRRTIEPYLE